MLLLWACKEQYTSRNELSDYRTQKHVQENEFINSLRYTLTGSQALKLWPPLGLFNKGLSYLWKHVNTLKKRRPLMFRLPMCFLGSKERILKKEQFDKTDYEICDPSLSTTYVMHVCMCYGYMYVYARVSVNKHTLSLQSGKCRNRRPSQNLLIWHLVASFDI
jgi:hypothetical protein